MRSDSVGQRGLPDEWWDSAMVCSFHLCDVHDKMACGKKVYEKGCGLNIYGPLILFGAKISYKSISFGRRGKAASSWQEDAHLNLHGICITCGEMMVRRFAHCGLRRPRDSVSLPHSSQAVQAPRNRTSRNTVVSMCRRMSQIFDIPQPPRSEMPARVNLEQDEKEEEDTLFEEENDKDFWSRSDDLIYRYHEVHRLKEANENRHR